MNAKEKVRSGKPKRDKTKPRFAPGMNQLLDNDSNRINKEDNQTTRVTRLFLDEHDPS